MQLTIGDYTWRYARSSVLPASLSTLTRDCHVHDPVQWLSNVAFRDDHAATLLIEANVNTDAYEVDRFTF